MEALRLHSGGDTHRHAANCSLRAARRLPPGKKRGQSACGGRFDCGYGALPCVLRAKFHGARRSGCGGIAAVGHSAPPGTSAGLVSGSFLFGRPGQRDRRHCARRHCSLGAVVACQARGAEPIRTSTRPAPCVLPSGAGADGDSGGVVCLSLCAHRVRLRQSSVLPRQRHRDAAAAACRSGAGEAAVADHRLHESISAHRDGGYGHGLSPANGSRRHSTRANRSAGASDSSPSSSPRR